MKTPPVVYAAAAFHSLLAVVAIGLFLTPIRPLTAFAIILGVILVSAHATAVVGIFRKAPWARRYTLVVTSVYGGILVLGVLTSLQKLRSAADIIPAFILLPLLLWLVWGFAKSPRVAEHFAARNKEAA